MEEFSAKCTEFFNKLLGGVKMDRKELFYTKKNGYDEIDSAEKDKIFSYCEGYKAFLDEAKTEREAVCAAVRLAEAKGFKELKRGDDVKPGDKVYKSIRGKALMLAVIGTESLADGANIAAAHIDSPRLDLKQIPLYEDSGMAMLKTHYYGGIKKYQWVTIPLA
ncbi:MAG: aminopeptidase, partial [Oscillospiraceae bacterium]|nr:aminopeptidase [Oscillospiraceae bacterium]